MPNLPQNLSRKIERIAKSPPKVGFIITEAEQETLRRLLPHGHKQAVFQAITRDLIEILEKNPDKRSHIIALILDGQLKFSEISPFLQKVQ